MEARLFGLTMKYLRRLAYRLPVKNGIGHRFQNGIASQDKAMDSLRDILRYEFPNPEQYLVQ